MVKLSYQKATPDDIPEIIELAEKIWLPAFARYFETDELSSLFSGMYNPQKLTETLSRKGYEFYFAREESGISVGYFATEFKDFKLKLDKIYIDPSLQRQGLGQEVYRHITQLAITGKAEIISLNVNRRNSSALSFYKKLGFEIIRSEDIPGPNGFVYDDYVMEITL